MPLTDEAIGFHLTGPGGPHARVLLWVPMYHRHTVSLKQEVKSLKQEKTATSAAMSRRYTEYPGLVLVWAAVVDRLSGSPVGVAEQPSLGPLEVSFGVRRQPHPQVNADIVQQGGDEGCEEKTTSNVQVWTNRLIVYAVFVTFVMTLFQVIGQHGQNTSLCLTFQLGCRPCDPVWLIKHLKTL